MSSPAPVPPQLPAVDERLVAPESRYEVEDGRVCKVPPSDEPHGTRHSMLAALLEAHVAGEYQAAIDLLTRTSEVDDIAPDASVFPRERDPDTGGRRVEQLAFEIASTQRLGDVANKARKLVGRGVRRVFAIDVVRQRAFEWSPATGSFRVLEHESRIEDPVLAVPLPVEVLVSAAKVDDALARALLQKNNPVLLSALASSRAEGQVSALLAVLAARGFAIDAATHARIASERDEQVLDRWVRRAATCQDVAELFAASDSR